MRAIVCPRYGGPEVLRFEEVPRPVPGPHQILIKVFCSSVNPVDWKRASGKFRLILPMKFPYIPGYDVSGVVEELGEQVKGFTVGMRVHARIGDEQKCGGCAEYALVGVDVATEMPARMDPSQGAALPLAGMTALQGLRDECGLSMEGSGKRVLIVGAAGGVGHLAVQLARAAGADVVGVCSSKNEAWVRGLGAHDIIDYQKKDAFQGLRPFDAILDCVGGDPATWVKRLNPEGVYASCVPGLKTILHVLANPIRKKKVRVVSLYSKASDLALLGKWFEMGKLRAAIDSRFELKDLAAAWERSMSGRSKGKIVIDIVRE